MWLDFILFIFFILVIDTAVRIVLIFRLRKKVYNKKNYRNRRNTFSKGNKRFAITLLGDSVIYGEGSEVDAPAASGLVEIFTKQDYEVTLHNLAVIGHTVSDVTKKQVPLMEKSDIVFVYVGANNYFKFHSTHKYLSELKDLAFALRGNKVMWITIGDPRFLWLLPIWLRWLFYFRARTFSKLLKEIVVSNSSERWYVIDFFIKGITEARRRKQSPRQLLSDGFHLSHAGQKLISDIIVDSYLKLIPHI